MATRAAARCAWRLPRAAAAAAGAAAEGACVGVAATAPVATTGASTRVGWARWGFSPRAFCSAGGAPGGSDGGDAHSGGEAPDSERGSDAAEQVLALALQKVPEMGWSDAALVAAAEELGLSGAAAAATAPRGGLDLVEAFVSRCDEEFEARLASPEMLEELAPLGVQQRLALLVRARLEMLGPVLRHWPQALALRADPRSAPAAVAAVARSVNAMWIAAGDTSTDLNWYSKRAVLAAVYGSAELYMLTDTSEGHADTWAFVQRRLDDAVSAGRTLSEGLRAAGLGGTAQQPSDSSGAANAHAAATDGGADGTSDDDAKRQ